MLKSEFASRIDKIPTPFYYYDLDLLHNTLSNALASSKKYGYILHYALKANADDRILQLIKDAGIGAKLLNPLSFFMLLTSKSWGVVLLRSCLQFLYCQFWFSF